MSADDPETSDWTDATVLKLLVAMKRSIPEDERHLSFYAGMRHMDWKTVAFPPFSPEACQQKWSEILATIRKTRTFGELMDEAEDVISRTEKYQLSLEENNRKMPESRKQSQKPSKDRKRKRKSDITLSPDEFPGEPKMPTQSACVVFREEQMILLREKVPSKKERFMKIDKMWKDLSDAEKEPYKEKTQENVMKYSMELQEWFKTLTAAVQEDYLTCKPSKREFLDGKTVANSKVARKMNFALLSDSELEDSSSDDDD